MKSVLTRATVKLALVLIGSACASPGFCGASESSFYISPDGSNVVFDVRDVSRRVVLDRLLRNRSIDHEWVDPAFADEPINGLFKGSPATVLQRFLAEANFVAVYNHNGDDLARLIILGRATSQSGSGLLAKIAGVTPSVKTAQMAKDDAGSSPPGAGENSKQPKAADPNAPALTPPPAAGAGPLFTPPSPKDAATPLFTPVTGVTAPPLVPPAASEVRPLIQTPSAKGK